VVDALVLAGGSARGIVAEEEMTPKALIDINGRPMLAYVLDVLEQAEQVESVTVVLPSSVQNLSCLDKADVVIHSDGSLTENFYKGVMGISAESPGRERQILSVTADIPLLTVQAVDDFIARCGETYAGIYYPIVAKSMITEKYPKVERTYVTLREGKFTGGNLFLFDRQLALDNRELLRKVTSARKSPLSLIRMLGLSFIIRFMFHSLTVRGLEEKVSSLVGERVIAVPTPYVEISVDVDKASDLDLVRSELASQR
jgi:GTP:adenosylcobinamide-phosphate guanylyltransferase